MIQTHGHAHGSSSPSTVAGVALAAGAAAAAMAALAGLHCFLESLLEAPLLRRNAEDHGRRGGALLGQVRVHLSASTATAAARATVAASTARHLLNF